MGFQDILEIIADLMIAIPFVSCYSPDIGFYPESFFNGVHRIDHLFVIRFEGPKIEEA